LKTEIINLEWTEGDNIIVGQSHFIKTVEDISEILASYAPSAEFGLAFNEASGPCLIRTEGNNEDLIKQAAVCAEKSASGHSFYLIIRGIFPIVILNQIKNCQEVCRVYAATGNPLQLIIAETELGRGIMGVIDGSSPVGLETVKDKTDRKAMLRQFGYKY